jgi:hypothetical protein
VPPDPDTDFDPAREDELAERGRALVAAAVSDVHAPHALRERLEAQRARRAPARRRRLLLVGALASAMVAVVLATALLVAPGGTPGGPTVVEAAALGTRPATAAAPASDRANPRTLQASEAGIRFPSWQDIDWPTTGARRDELGGRSMTTVFYNTGDGAPVAYTIVAGKALAPPKGATTTQLGGTEVRRLQRNGRWIVTWERNGHTCILSAPRSVPVDSLVGLTTWS